MAAVAISRDLELLRLDRTLEQSKLLQRRHRDPVQTSMKLCLELPDIAQPRAIPHGEIDLAAAAVPNTGRREVVLPLHDVVQQGADGLCSHHIAEDQMRTAHRRPAGATS